VHQGESGQLLAAVNNHLGTKRDDYFVCLLVGYFRALFQHRDYLAWSGRMIDKLEGILKEEVVA
jgi:hypothetical protein